MNATIGKNLNKNLNKNSNNKVFNKEKWISLFKKVGLTNEQMKLWHQHLEMQYPDDHQSFLEWLNLSTEEILLIRGA